jgi:hypothetical protein
VMQGAHDAFLRACRFHHLDLAFKAYDCLHSFSGTFFYYMSLSAKKSSLFLCIEETCVVKGYLSIISFPSYNRYNR